MKIVLKKKLNKIVKGIFGRVIYDLLNNRFIELNIVRFIELNRINNRVIHSKIISTEIKIKNYHFV